MSGADGLLEELARWGSRAEALSAEATKRTSEAETRLRRASAAVARALEALRETDGRLEPTDDGVHRIEEIAGGSVEAAVRTDLLALNFQVEAARLGDDDRGLEQVAHEIRTLADRGARGAQEVYELAGRVQRELQDVRSRWARGRGHLGVATEDLERAVRVAVEAGDMLAEARGAAAQFHAATQAHEEGERAARTDRRSLALRMASAVQVREQTFERLVGALSGRVQQVSVELKVEAETAEALAGLVEAFEERLSPLFELVGDADEVARRTKQLAINADLAAARSEDPAVGLFAEEARRLSEHAEVAASTAQARLVESRKVHLPRLEASRGLADALRSLGQRLEELLDPVGEVALGDEDARDVAQTWREDRAAARQLAQARAEWGALSRDEPPA